MNKTILKENLMAEILPITLIFAGIFSRLVPHPPNFTSINALGVFAGMYLPKKRAHLVPITAMFLSDLFIGFYDLKIMFTVYLSFLLSVSIGQILSNKNYLNSISGTMVGSLIFFLISNLGVWLWSGLYPPTINGLANSYLMAVPFLKNNILADLFFGSILFMIVKLANKLSERKQSLAKFKII